MIDPALEGEANSGKTGVTWPCVLHVKQDKLASSGGGLSVSNGESDIGGVNQALARLLGWPEIARSPQLANFLTYIVERRLSGDTQSIKAYSIAVDVFGRPSDFDPQADPIVRVQARRLRGLLDQYYRGPGAGDPVRIQLPIGRYVPEFIDSATEPVSPSIDPEPNVTADEPSKPMRRGVTMSWYVLLALTLVATIVSYSVSMLGQRRAELAAAIADDATEMPRLRIMEFQNLTGDTSLTPYIAALAVELVTDFAPVLIVDAAYGGRGTVGVDTTREDDYVLTGVVRSAEEGAYEFNAILTDADTMSVVWNWSETVERERILEQDGLDYVSRELISRMGNPRGPLHAEARAYLDGTDIAGHENAYLCGLLFASYRAEPRNGSFARVDACLAALPETQTAESAVLAARASLLVEAIAGGRWNSEAQQARNDEAGELLSEALRAMPTSSFSWEQQARYYEAIGEHDDAQAAYTTALQLNSASIDALAASARHTALIGNLEQAIPLAQRAVAAVPAQLVPGWYYCVPAMAALQENALQRAQRLAELCGRVDVELGSILMLLAAKSADDAGMLGQTLSRILDIPSFRSSGIMVRLGLRMTDAALLEQIETALRDAGVPESSLTGPY